MRDVTEFSVGDILKLSFSVYFSSLPAFLPLSLIAFVPLFAVLLLFDSSSFNNPVVPDPAVLTPLSAEYWEFMAVIYREYTVTLLCGIWLQAGLAFGVVRHLRGGNSSYLGTFANSLRMMLAAALVTLVVGIAIGMGLLLLVVPGVIIALVWWVALPAAVVERSGFRALGRSSQLTRGYKGQIFGLALILTILQMVVSSIVYMLTRTVMTDPVVGFIAQQLCGVVLAGVWATAVSVTYHDLRVLKEGVDARVVSQVFE